MPETHIIPLRIFARDDAIVSLLKAARGELIQIEAEEEAEALASRGGQNHGSDLRDVIDRLTTIILRAAVAALASRVSIALAVTPSLPGSFFQHHHRRYK